LKFRVGEGENKVAAKKNFLRDIEEYKVSVAKSREEVKVHAPPLLDGNIDVRPPRRKSSY
jgi:hypothetical protein